MNDRNSEQLLKDLLAGEELSDFRSMSLERGLTAIHVRRRRRRLVTIALLTTLPIAVLVVFLFNQSVERMLHPPRFVSPKLVASAPNKLTPAIQIIDDEELLALFPDRPVALVGKAGQQQLVLLNQTQVRLSQ